MGVPLQGPNWTKSGRDWAAQALENTIVVKVIYLKRDSVNSGDDYTSSVICFIFVDIKPT